MGSLRDLLKSESTGATTEGDICRWQRTGSLLPEAFIWHVFHALTRAIRSMRSGPSKFREEAAREGSKQLKWRPFLHRDFKDRNILLVEARDKEARKRNWPTPVVADYGLAIDLDHYSLEDREAKIGWYVNRGTPGNRDPETL